MKYTIFDLDGTLLDSMGIWENIDVEFLSKYGFKPTDEIRNKLKVLSVRQSSEFFKMEFKLQQSVDEIMSEIAELCVDKYKFEVELKHFVYECLQELKQNNVKMCIASASARRNIISAMTRLKIIDFFDFIIAADDILTGKDNPEIFLTCAERFGAKPEEITVFEDALHAIKTAKKAGFKVIGVYDESAKDDIDEIKKICDKYIYDWNEVGELL